MSWPLVPLNCIEHGSLESLMTAQSGANTVNLPAMYMSVPVLPKLVTQFFVGPPYPATARAVTFMLVVPNMAMKNVLCGTVRMASTKAEPLFGPSVGGLATYNVGEVTLVGKAL